MSSVGYIQGLGGKGGYPPNWNEIGYSDTPSEIMTAFEYAKYIRDNWTVNQKFTGDKGLFFFPNLDMSEYGLYNAYFDSSNLMHIDPITIGFETASGSAITCQTMFKNTLISDITVSAKNSTQLFNTNTMFIGCGNLKRAELNLASNNMQGIFGDCIKLERVEGNLNASSVTTMVEAFRACSSLTYVTDLATSAATNFYRCFQNCLALENVPTFDYTSATNLQQMFWNCSSIKNVPLMNIPRVTNLTNMFQSTRSNLTDTSRDNILQMCVSATAFTGTKKLTTLGFSSSMYSAASWQALPHYTDFTNAGWTIGYS